MTKLNTKLIKAARDGCIQAVQQLLACGANIEAVNQYGNTALIWAAAMGHSEIVQELLARGANIGVVNQDGNTALIWAAYRGHSETVQLLLDRGANIEAIKQYYRYTALIGAATKGHSKTVQLLLARGANIEAADRWRNTALLCAARWGNSKTVQLLLDRGANIEAVNQYGDTALRLAAGRGHSKTVLLLARYGASDANWVYSFLNLHDRNSLSVINDLREKSNDYCKKNGFEFLQTNFIAAIEYLESLKLKHSQRTAQMQEQVCFRFQLMQAIPRQNMQACLSAVKNNTALMLAFVFSENNDAIKRNKHMRGILNFASIRIFILQYCGNPLPDLDKQSQIALCQKVPSLSILSGAVTDMQRMARRLYRNQVIAAVTPAVVSAPIAACLFGTIPYLGIIAVLPAMLILVAGIAISIAARLVIRANAKRAHMQ